MSRNRTPFWLVVLLTISGCSGGCGESGRRTNLSGDAVESGADSNTSNVQSGTILPAGPVREVPAEYATIISALEVAQDGEIIRLAAGEYPAPTVYKSVIIEGNHQETRLVGTVTLLGRGSAVFGCIIQDPNICVRSRGSRVSLSYCTLLDGSVIVEQNSSIEVSQCTLDGRRDQIQTTNPAIMVMPNANAEVHDNIFEFWYVGIAAAMPDANVGHLWNCVFWQNRMFWAGGRWQGPGNTFMDDPRHTDRENGQYWLEPFSSAIRTLTRVIDGQRLNEPHYLGAWQPRQ